MKNITRSILLCALVGCGSTEETTTDVGTETSTTTGSTSTTSTTSTTTTVTTSTTTTPTTSTTTTTTPTTTTTTGGYDIYESMVDASTSQVFFDLDTQSVVAAGAGWDLAVNRYEILVNGGVNGDEGVEVAVHEGEYDLFDSSNEAPADGYITDTNAGNAFDTWYDYNYSTHEVTPADVLYFVHTSDGEVMRFRILSYYDGSGASGHVSFEYGYVD